MYHMHKALLQGITAIYIKSLAVSEICGRLEAAVLLVSGLRNGRHVPLDRLLPTWQVMGLTVTVLDKNIRECTAGDIE